MSMPSATSAALAAHRFGLGEPALERIAADPQAWLLSQIGPADAAWGTQLPTSLDGVRLQYAYNQARRNLREPANLAGKPQEQQFAEHFRTTVEADLQSRLLSAVQSARPFNERLVLFWANHFTVSMAKAPVRGLVGAFEREAIRPHVAGSFEAMLKAAVTHAAMLRYLDNAASAGPNSRLAARRSRRVESGDMRTPRVTGLNENLAREVLELHTLGVQGGYSQADVTAFAALLTGWRVVDPQRANDPDASASYFDPLWHEPGSKTVLGKTYAEGPQALDKLLHDLTLHPSTARFVATKLARHFVGDQPPAALVDRLAQSFQRSGGQLPDMYRTLVSAPEAWSQQQTKLKTPEEFVISSARLLGLGEGLLGRGRDGGIGAMGQRVQAAPSPAGWPDSAQEWLGPEGVWKRVEWASRLAARVGSQVDARLLSVQSLGTLLSEATARQIERAVDGPQALTLLLMSPEFQRR